MTSPIGSLKGLVAFVTGGASGLGRATVERFLRQGAKGVIAYDRSDFEQNEYTTNVKDQLIPINGDVTNEENVNEALKQCQDKFGKLDVVVNCAGVGIAIRTYNYKKNVPHPLDLFRQVIEINTIGSFNVARLACELIGKNEPVNGLRGVIINTASIAAFEGELVII